MKRLDYYIIYGILLSVGMFLLIMTDEKVFAGVFLGVFIAGIEKLIGVKHDDAEIVKNALLQRDEKDEDDFIKEYEKTLDNN